MAAASATAAAAADAGAQLTDSAGADVRNHVRPSRDVAVPPSRGMLEACNGVDSHQVLGASVVHRDCGVSPSPSSEEEAGDSSSSSSSSAGAGAAAAAAAGRGGASSSSSSSAGGADDILAGSRALLHRAVDHYGPLTAPGTIFLRADWPAYAPALLDDPSALLGHRMSHGAFALCGDGLVPGDEAPLIVSGALARDVLTGTACASHLSVAAVPSASLTHPDRALTAAPSSATAPVVVGGGAKRGAAREEQARNVLLRLIHAGLKLIYRTASTPQNDATDAEDGDAEPPSASSPASSSAASPASAAASLPSSVSPSLPSSSSPANASALVLAASSSLLARSYSVTEMINPSAAALAPSDAPSLPRGRACFARTALGAEWGEGRGEGSGSNGGRNGGRHGGGVVVGHPSTRPRRRVARRAVSLVSFNEFAQRRATKGFPDFVLENRAGTRKPASFLHAASVDDDAIELFRQLTALSRRKVVPLSDVTVIAEWPEYGAGSMIHQLVLPVLQSLVEGRTLLAPRTNLWAPSDCYAQARHPHHSIARAPHSTELPCAASAPPSQPLLLLSSSSSSAKLRIH